MFGNNRLMCLVQEDLNDPTIAANEPDVGEMSGFGN